MRPILALLCVGIFVCSAGVAGLQVMEARPGPPLEVTPLGTDGYDLVIVAPEAFTRALQPLVDHKRDHGVATLLETVESIVASYEGRDDAEKLKYYLKDAIEDYGISYVLLVGGRKPLGSEWHVPVRYAHVNDQSGYQEFLSDLYFADIYNEAGHFEDWDSNGNDVFGEFSLMRKDVMDLRPDVALGRLPCRTVREVDIVGEKIIDYETTAYAQSWCNRMVAIGGNSFPVADPEPFPYEGEATCDVATSYMDDYEVVKLYTSDSSFMGTCDLVNAINDGCGFVLTRGKGGTDRVRMVTQDGEELIALQNLFVPLLRNHGQYPIIVLGECIHGKFDVSVMNLLEGDTPDNCVPECIAWRLVRCSGGGAIATLTNTNLCYGAPGDNDGNGIPDDAELYGGRLAVDIFRLIGEGMQTLGDIHAESVRSYVDDLPVMDNVVHCKSVQEFILLGDPSLHIGGYP